jgi:hypothetical protein
VFFAGQLNFCRTTNTNVYPVLDNMASLVVNELLCFLSAPNDKIDRENLSTILTDLYTVEETVDAKQILIEQFPYPI